MLHFLFVCSVLKVGLLRKLHCIVCVCVCVCVSIPNPDDDPDLVVVVVVEDEWPILYKQSSWVDYCVLKSFSLCGRSRHTFSACALWSAFSMAVIMAWYVARDPFFCHHL